ncbi:MAG: magnesium-translocating P-type ATPase [Sphingobacteriales bacterium]|nr:magnesium-translocating P-type ATPase [Sphingobacteriales bacterium]
MENLQEAIQMETTGQSNMAIPASLFPGLSNTEAQKRLEEYGYNEIAREKPLSWWKRLWNNIKNPLVILLLVLGFISYLTSDVRATLVILVMVVLGIVLRYVQEMRADHAAEKLRAMVRTHATVIRDGEKQDLPIKMLVPGDIILLECGDMVPADVQVLEAKDLFINQSALTGESMPVEKSAGPVQGPENPLERLDICYLGSDVESGIATARVIHTGDETYFGSLATNIVGSRVQTSFDKGVNKFTWLMIRFIFVMVPAVFLINGLSRQNWMEAFLFALAVAVGLTPEMLPMIVTVNLSKGALIMSKKKVIVKRLNSIQNFGAMDILCTDKTGTITEGRIVLEKYLDLLGDANQKVLKYGYLNSYFHTGLKNLMDDAVLDHKELEEELIREGFKKIDEIPFDFIRKRMSVVIQNGSDNHILICKGAVEGLTDLCTKVEIAGEAVALTTEYRTAALELAHNMNKEGFRVIALAYKVIPQVSHQSAYTVGDEACMVLLGFLSFLDPPRASAPEALERLRELNVELKILTGDNEIITTYICKKVGIKAENLLLGSQIESMSDQELADAVGESSVFARLVPAQKKRIIRALQSRGHVIGFMGDGINDAPALKSADVGISVNSAVDIAKESSDIILLENSLLVLERGVIEGRKVFGNIIKYIKMAASSNFGNMFSVVGASAFLPFLPMLPLQVLTNNLLYDFSQTTIPTDNVDKDWLIKPRKWSIASIQRFILFIGPISSIFDYITFFLMLYVFDGKNNPALFHTGWFVESIFTQTLIIHVIRTNKIPFVESVASWPLILTSVIIVMVGAWLTMSPLAGILGFVPLPPLYWVLLVFILVCYVGLTQVVKNWFNRTYPAEA